MENNLNFDAFLYLSSKKIILSINQIQNFKSIYKNEILLNSISDEIDHIKLDNFLKLYS